MQQEKINNNQFNPKATIKELLFLITKIFFLFISWIFIALCAVLLRGGGMGMLGNGKNGVSFPIVMILEIILFAVYLIRSYQWGSKKGLCIGMLLGLVPFYFILWLI